MSADHNQDLTINEIDTMIEDARKADLHDPTCRIHRDVAVHGLRLSKMLIRQTSETNMLLATLAGTMKAVQENQIAEAQAAAAAGPEFSMFKGMIAARGKAATLAAVFLGLFCLVYGGLGLNLYFGQRRIQAETKSVMQAVQRGDLKARQTAGAVREALEPCN